MSPQFSFHQLVMTPNGPATVQGRIHEKDAEEKIIVSHLPDQSLPPELQKCWFGGPWILWSYNPSDLTEVTKP